MFSQRSYVGHGDRSLESIRLFPLDVDVISCTSLLRHCSYLHRLCSPRPLHSGPMSLVIKYTRTRRDRSYAAVPFRARVSTLFPNRHICATGRRELLSSLMKCRVVMRKWL